MRSDVLGRPRKKRAKNAKEIHSPCTEWIPDTCQRRLLHWTIQENKTARFQLSLVQTIHPSETSKELSALSRVSMFSPTEPRVAR